MKSWKLTYELTDHFCAPVTGHSYCLRSFPQERESQKILSMNCEVFPCSGVSRGRDSFGNRLMTGCIPEPHGEFRVRVEAEAATDGRPEPEGKSYWQLGMYRYATRLTAPGEGLRAFGAEVRRQFLRETDFDRERPNGQYGDWIQGRALPWRYAAFLMDALRHSFHYEKGTTDFDTTAEAAFRLGAGVCQDYAHIFLALCREAGLTARYVAGTVPGEGESHAWAEVWQEGFWQGFDPTHNRLADEDYLFFALGRDAADCCLCQGIYRGGAGQRQEVRVRMEELVEEEGKTGGEGN